MAAAVATSSNPLADHHPPVVHKVSSFTTYLINPNSSQQVNHPATAGLEAIKELAGAMRWIISKEIRDLFSWMQQVQREFFCVANVEKKIEAAMDTTSDDSMVSPTNSASFVAIATSELKMW